MKDQALDCDSSCHASSVKHPSPLHGQTTPPDGSDEATCA